MGCTSSSPKADQSNAKSKSKAVKANEVVISVEEQEEENYNLEDLESFVQLCLYRGNKINAIKMFLKDESALLALVKFLSRDDLNLACLQNQAENGRVLQEIFKASSEYSKANKAVEGLVEKYTRNSTTIPADAKKTDETSAEAIFRQNEALALTAANVLPKFLTSPQFQEWREAEANKGLSQPLLDMIESQDQKNGVAAHFMEPKGYKDKETKEYLKAKSSYQGLSSYTQKAFASLDPLEVKNIAKSRYLSTFLGAVEGLPICVSLATASQSRRGFPLIYVNSIFEETTGYSRTEIIGRNCAFLQQSKDGESESEYFTIKLLSEALKDAKPVYATITNYRKNGEKFKNLLAMKPLFDADGVYSYVVGLQFEVSNADGKHRSLATVNDLLSMLPDRLPRTN